MWKRPLTLLKVFFFLNRYLCLIEFIGILVSISYVWDPLACERFDRWDPYMSIMVNISASSILIMRVYALYDRSKAVLISLIVLLVVDIGVSLSAGYFVAPQKAPVGCLATKTVLYFDAFYIGPMVFDTAILVMTLYVGLSKLRYNSNGIISLFLRDGFLYFVVIFGINTINLIFFLAADELIQPINASAATILTSIMASRISFNLKEFYNGDQDDTKVVQAGSVQVFKRVGRGGSSGRSGNSIGNSPRCPANRDILGRAVYAHNIRKTSEIAEDTLPLDRIRVQVNSDRQEDSFAQLYDLEAYGRRGRPQ